MLTWEDRDQFKNTNKLRDSLEGLGRSMVMQHGPSIWQLRDNEKGRFWFMHSKVWEYPFAEMWLKSLAKSLGKTSLNVMDFGCWLCPFPEYLAGQGHTVWGVDDDDWRHMRQCDMSSHYPNVRYHIDDVRKLEITGFDAIISCSVLEHIEPTLRIELLRHLKSMLQPNGKQMHLVDFYFPEKKNRDHDRMNFYEVADEMGWHIPKFALCPGSPTFDFEQARSRINFIRKDHEARIAIGDDLCL